MPAPSEFSGLGLGFSLGGLVGDEETGTVVVFAEGSRQASTRKNAVIIWANASQSGAIGDEGQGIVHAPGSLNSVSSGNVVMPLSSNPMIKGAKTRW